MNRKLTTPSNLKCRLHRIPGGLGLIGAACLIGVMGFFGTVGADSAKGDFRVNGQTVPSTLASVNGVDLPASYLQSQLETYRLMNRQQGHAPSSVGEGRFARQTVSQLVDQELIFQKSREMNISVDSKTIENEIEKIREQFPSSDLFQAALEIQGLTPVMLRTTLEKQLAEDEWIRRAVVPEVQIGDPEVESYYKNNADQFSTPEQYAVSHIFVASLEPAPDQLPEELAMRQKAERLQKLLDQDALEKAEKILRRVEADEDFSNLAEEFSEDEVSRLNGGSLGSVLMEDLPPKMGEAVKQLQPGHSSGIVRSAYGYHILKLDEKIPAGMIELAQVKSDILNLLLKEKVLAVRQSHLEKLRNQADIRLFY